MTSGRVARAVLALSLLALAAPGAAAEAKTYKVGEYRLPDRNIDQLRGRFANQIESRYARGTWAPMKYELSNADLKLMGLPSKKVLLSRRYKKPTAVYPSGRMVTLPTKRKRGDRLNAAATPVISVAGAGYFGIRPGAWVLLMNGGSIGWGAPAHVYGGTSIATAGHCGNAGDTATVIGALGDKTVSGLPVPVLMDFGRFSSSTGDGGIGNDWALIGVDAPYRPLMTPTMAFWGGPIGMYTPNGDVVDADLTTGDISVTPNPVLAQGIVHYGHGTGIGAGGTPRSGAAISWKPDHFAFFGAITPGDSGSGSNTVTGDTVGSNREAAGINTHIFVDGSLRTGLGVMAGTRATKPGTVTNGQIVPYPAPTPVALP